MTECTRFVDEGLEKLEAGETLDTHFSECDACIRERDSYERLKGALRSLDDQQPDDGWQSRVLEHATGHPAEYSGRATRWLVAAGVAAAAAAIWTFMYFGTPDTTLQLAIIDGDTVYRGATARPGDSLRLSTTARRAANVELRLYRDENQLVFACDNTPPCQRDGAEISATVELSAFGEYHAVLLTSDESITPALGSLDGDVLRAREANANVVIAESVLVQ